MSAVIVPPALSWPEAMKEYRRRRGTKAQPLTRAALAFELGVHPNTVRRFERGTYTPRQGSLLERTLRDRFREIGIVVAEVADGPSPA